MIKILWIETAELYTVQRGKEAGRSLGVQIDSLEMSDLVLSADEEKVGFLHNGHVIVQQYDAVIMRSFMPFVSEALTLARLFREAGKIVVDASMTEEGYAMSKMHDYIVLASRGVAVPRTRQFFFPTDSENFAESIGYPCIVKGIHGSEGRHVHKVESASQLRKRLLQYRAGEVMIQEYLDAQEDYRVIVIGYKALPVFVVRKPKPGDFRTNFDFNETVISRPIAEYPQLKILAENAAIALRREFSGVDIRFRGSVPVVLEANRRPGFKGFEEATQFDVAGALISYVIEKIASKSKSLSVRVAT